VRAAAPQRAQSLGAVEARLPELWSEVRPER
jgi:hypothetical protein